MDTVKGLSELLRAVLRSESLRECGEGILRVVLSLLPEVRAAILLALDKASRRFVPVASVGLEPDRPVAVSEGVLRELLAGGTGALLVSGERIRALWGDVSPQVTLAFPLWDAGELVGCILLGEPTQPGGLSAEDVKILEPFGDILASIIRFGTEFQELRDRERFLRFLFERVADAVYVTSFAGEILEANPAAERQTGYSREELLRMNIMRDLAVGEPVVTYDQVNERLHRGEVVIFEEEKRRKDGTLFWTEVAVALFEYRGKPAMVSVNRDITARKQLEAELKRKVAQLEALNRPAGILAAKLELEELLRSAITVIREITGADYAGLMLFDKEGRVRRVVEAEGTPPVPLRMRRRGFASLVRDMAEPLLIDEIRPDGTTIPPVRWPGESEPVRANPLLLELGIRSSAMVPIVHGDRVLGVLSVHSHRPRAFTDQRDLLSALASSIAVALINARTSTRNYGRARIATGPCSGSRSSRSGWRIFPGSRLPWMSCAGTGWRTWMYISMPIRNSYGRAWPECGFWMLTPPRCGSTGWDR